MKNEERKKIVTAAADETLRLLLLLSLMAPLRATAAVGARRALMKFTLSSIARSARRARIQNSECCPG